MITKKLIEKINKQQNKKLKIITLLKELENGMKNDFTYLMNLKYKRFKFDWFISIVENKNDGDIEFLIDKQDGEGYRIMLCICKETTFSETIGMVNDYIGDLITEEMIYNNSGNK